MKIFFFHRPRFALYAQYLQSVFLLVTKMAVRKKPRMDGGNEINFEPKLSGLNNLRARVLAYSF